MIDIIQNSINANSVTYQSQRKEKWTEQNPSTYHIYHNDV